MGPKLIAIALCALLAGALAASSLAAPPQNKAGHNPPTKLLESAFKTAGYERAGSADGCFPSPEVLAASIASREGIPTGVAKTPKQAKRNLVAYVVRKGTHCNKVTFATRFRREIWVLDSIKGTVSPIGRKGNLKGDDSIIGNRGKLRGLKMRSKSFTLNTFDDPERYDVRCPGKSFPMGGGYISSPGPDPDGAGAYPHTYERLGAQRGWHINSFMHDPDRRTLTPRKVTLQVICGFGLAPHSAPRKVFFVRSGESESAVARCPKGQQIFTGGYQRANFLGDGGSYTTENRAVGTRAWRVSGAGHGAYGGELSAIAYCVRSKKPLISTVQASVPLPAGGVATATTPKCPGKRRLLFGGYSSNGSSQIWIEDNGFTKKGRWTVTGFGRFGGADRLTAIGYCLKPGV